VQEVAAQIEQTQAVDPTNRGSLLFGARGTWKTSLLRHLAERRNMPEAASADACWSLMLVVRRYVDEDPETLLCAVVIWHLLRIFDEQHAVEDVTFQATNFADVINLVKGNGHGYRFSTNLAVLIGVLSLQASVKIRLVCWDLSGIFQFLWSHLVFGESLRSLYQSLCAV